MVLNVVARRRSSGGPESTTARMARSPSASRPAAVSSPASGLLTHRARPKASRAAPIMATTAIVPRMTQSLTTSLFSELVDLARITVPASSTTSCSRTPRATSSASSDDYACTLSSRTTMAFETGVLLPIAALASGTSTFASGKYAAAQPRAVGYATTR